MPALKIDFVSYKDPKGYEYVPDPSGAPGRIVRRGSTLEPINPLEFHESLYLHFAKLDLDAEAHVGFISKFGPLTHHGNTPGIGEDLLILQEMQTSLDHWLNEAGADPANLTKGRWVGMSQNKINAWVADTVELKKKRGLEADAFYDQDQSHMLSSVATLQAEVGLAPPDGRPILSLRPDTLWDGLKLQFYQAVCSGAQLRTCGWCGNWFEVGGSHKRSISEYCSDKCRLQAHRHKNRGRK
jgi:hypothetical protein